MKFLFTSVLLLLTQVSCAQPKERPAGTSTSSPRALESTTTTSASLPSKNLLCQGKHPSLKALNLCVGFRWLQKVEDKWVPTENISTMDDESVLQIWFYSSENPHLIVKPTFPLKVFLYMQMSNGSHHPGPRGTITLLQDGSYRVHGLQFFMPDMWQVHIQALQADKKTVLDSTFFEQSVN